MESKSLVVNFFTYQYIGSDLYFLSCLHCIGEDLKLLLLFLPMPIF